MNRTAPQLDVITMKVGSYFKDEDEDEYLVVTDKENSEGISAKKNQLTLLSQSGTSIEGSRANLLDRNIRPSSLVTTIEKQMGGGLTPEQKIEAFKTEFDIE